MTIEIEQSNRQRCQRISEKTFPIIKGLKTLELGPQDGSWFTKHLLTYTRDVTVIELSKTQADILKSNYPMVNVLVDDFNECLRTVGQFEAVVVYGVLYHSHAPLRLLEDIANYVKPQYILIENILGSGSGNWAIVDEEEPNTNGMRFSQNKSCKLVISLGQTWYAQALTNLGYRKVEVFDVGREPDLMASPGNLKKPAFYTTWKLL